MLHAFGRPVRASTAALGLSIRWLRMATNRPIVVCGMWQFMQRLPTAVLLARVIPGLRLVTYTACGFLRVPLAPFCAWVVLAVGVWTAGLYLLSVSVGAVLAQRWGVPPALAVALPIFLLAVAVPLVRAIQQRRKRIRA